MREEIIQFLESQSQDYARGVFLLYSATKSDALRNALLRFPSDYKLRKHLRSYLDTTTADIDSPKIESNPPESQIAEHPLEIKALLDKRTHLFKLLSYHHAQLTLADNDTDRYTLMHQCVLFDADLADIEGQLRFYRAHDRLPIRQSVSKQQHTDPTTAQIELRIRNLYVSIYADKRLIKTMTAQIAIEKDIASLQKINDKLAKAKARLRSKTEEMTVLKAQRQAKK